jgi:regulator of sigma E protease
MQIVQNIFWLLVLLGIMILIHEFGHFWAARFFKVRVESFSIGFGPRLFGFKSGDTDFRFSLILFGGYVKMAGQDGSYPNMDGKDSTADQSDPGALNSKPRWQRLIIAFAGPFMNILLAVGLVTGLFMVRFPKLPVVHSPVVGYVEPGSPAEKAGIREGDRVVQVDDQNDPTWEDIQLKEIASANRPMHVAVMRDNKREMFTVTPELDEKIGIGRAGWSEEEEVQVARVYENMGAAQAGLKADDTLVSVNGQPIRSKPKLHDVIKASGTGPVELVYKRDGQLHTVSVTPAKTTIDGQERLMIGVQLESRMVITQLAFPDALRESVVQNAKSAGVIYKFLQSIVERRMSAKTLEGPVRIAQLSGDAAREGATAFIGLMAMVSLNLAIFNLLPIPILDGGVILLLLVEMILRRDLSMQVKEAVVRVGFVFLMAVVVFVLYNDITKIMAG